MSQQEFIDKIITPIKGKSLRDFKDLKLEKEKLINIMKSLNQFTPDDEFYSIINFLSDNKNSFFMNIVGKNLHYILNEKDVLLSIEKTFKNYPNLSSLLSFNCAKLIASSKYNIDEIIENLHLLEKTKSKFSNFLFKDLGKSRALKFLPYFNQTDYLDIAENVFINNKHFNFFNINDVSTIIKNNSNLNINHYLLNKINNEKICLITDFCFKNNEYMHLMFKMINSIILNHKKEYIDQIIELSKEYDFPDNLYLLMLYRLNITQKQENKNIYSLKIFKILNEKNKSDNVIGLLGSSISIPELNFTTNDLNIINKIKVQYINYYKNYLSTQLPQKQGSLKVTKI